MKHWKETADIVNRVAQLAGIGRRAALATVVRIEGSSYRRAGAKFLVEDDGRTLGGVSGGCLEADVREVALGVIRTGVPRLLHYDTGADDKTVWGLGLGCNGSVDIFVQPSTTPTAGASIHTLQELLRQEVERFAICTVVDAPADVGHSVIVDAHGRLIVSTGPGEADSDLADFAAVRLTAGRSSLDRLGDRQVFAEILRAPPRLIVCGAGDDGRPLVAYASDVGFSVTVVDHRPAYLSADRFPSARRLLLLRPDGDLASLGIDSQSFVVVKTHSFGLDRDWVRGALRARAAYVGLLGPRGRKDQILRQLGLDSERLFGPIGLDVGAEGPEQIAISIVAELLAFRARRDPWHLHEKREAIHAG